MKIGGEDEPKNFSYFYTSRYLAHKRRTAKGDRDQRIESDSQSGEEDQKPERGGQDRNWSQLERLRKYTTTIQEIRKF